MITYLSSLYNVFPEPPKLHPLFDIESQKQAQEYRTFAQQLLLWLREQTSLLQEKSVDKSLFEIKRLLEGVKTLRNVEVPEKQKEKQRLTILYSHLEVRIL